jgi:hypothetical protein
MLEVCQQDYLIGGNAAQAVAELKAFKASQLELHSIQNHLLVTEHNLTTLG